MSFETYTPMMTDIGTCIRAGKNTVTFTCTSDYRDAAGYILGEWGLITEEAIRILTEESLAREHIYAKGDRNIQFSVFEREDGGREIYFLATDWHKPNPDGVGKLIIGEDEYEIPVPWGQLVKAVAFGDGALYPESDENEVISLEGTHARVQGVSLAAFVWCHDGKTQRIQVDFTAQSVRDICLEA